MSVLSVLGLAVKAAKAGAEEGSELAVKRVRQAPSRFGVDNPGGDWLRHEQEAAEARISRGGRSPVSGATTAWSTKPVMVSPYALSRIPGAMNENRRPGEYQYDNLRPQIEAEGFRQDSPILIGINHRGDPYIIEGNTRAAVARDLGIGRIPAEIRWFAGGEQAHGPEALTPAAVPSRLLDRDPRWPGVERRLYEKYELPRRGLAPKR